MDKNLKILCPKCQQKKLYKVRGTYHFKESGLDNVILENITLIKCNECDVVMPQLPAVETLHSIIAIKIVEKPETLNPKEIRFLRKNLGLSAVEFAKKLDVTKQTVSRWENGESKLGDPNDKVIRFLYILFKYEEIFQHGEQNDTNLKMLIILYKIFKNNLMALFKNKKEKKAKEKPNKISKINKIKSKKPEQKSISKIYISKDEIGKFPYYLIENAQQQINEKQYLM